MFEKSFKADFCTVLSLAKRKRVREDTATAKEGIVVAEV
jgi:hypothetical protein